MPRIQLSSSAAGITSTARDAVPVTKPTDAGKQAIQKAKKSLPIWPFLIAAGLAGSPLTSMCRVSTWSKRMTPMCRPTRSPSFQRLVPMSANCTLTTIRASRAELLVQLDPRDFQVAVDNAEATLLNALAAKSNIEQQISEQSDTISESDAAVSGDRATLAFAEQELSRYGTVANDGAGTMERWQQAQSDIGERKAALLHDLATLRGSKTHLNVLRAQAAQADAMIATQSAVLAQARLNLSYTKIYAEVSGTVANRTVQVGNYVQPGQLLFSAVPNRVYVIANFKEDQLTQMKVGQKVIVRVDAFPGRRLHAHIDSLQRGTGSYFALLPPENATGNFVKVVQRVPVKIVFDEDGETLRGVSPRHVGRADGDRRRAA
jgi:membrane fusion protein, multidrug efflux system